ncbi:hypothetical protein IU436_29770 [Nocardia farcinica]|uniref:hypothetical protein n=1 Tax=Nocardia farcinica TaxID=37329 RepID=UPI001895E65E|nr:hypothetical protein [Nocardia farcinica]MBF6422893.1 hypothetical protein [Nocardia farcinica]MBF6434509.1 hypothetical protein [Nocardia farcinica]MBF6505594.1 hypothetical protein [Nocardia farcinica]
MPSTYLRDAARRRAARHGSYQRALQALTRYDTPTPTGEPRNPAGIDWSSLYGLEVSLDNGSHQLRGVVLPPDGVRPGADILRVAVTSEPRTRPAPAEVTYLDARRWTISPMPADVDRRLRPSRKLTRGPKGLHLYRFDDLPATALATRTMLRTQHRARPADDQAPIAEYYTGYRYSALYAIDDAQPLPALPAGRQAAWINARTCARCAAQDTRPYSRSADGHRYCQPCWAPAADDWWAARLDRAQQAVITWARELVTDPNAVLIDAAGYPFTRFLVVEVATGTTLYDLTVLVDQTPLSHGLDSDECPPYPDHDSDAELCELAAMFDRIRHRRILRWHEDEFGVAIRSLSRLRFLRPELQLAGRLRCEPRPGESPAHLEQYYSYWLQQREITPDPESRWSSSWFGDVALRGYAPATVTFAPGSSSGRREHLPTRIRGDLDTFHLMASGRPDPATIPAPPQRRRAPIWVTPRDLDEPIG